MDKSFLIELKTEVMLELDEKVISVVDDRWRAQLYDLNTPEDIAKHIAFNMVINGAKLSELDGWADQPDHNAILRVTPQWELEVTESK